MKLGTDSLNQFFTSSWAAMGCACSGAINESASSLFDPPDAHSDMVIRVSPSENSKAMDYFQQGWT